MNTVYMLEHTGHYLGGVIIVVESSDIAAAMRIQAELESSGVEPDQYDLNDIQPIDINQVSTLYLSNGDY